MKVYLAKSIDDYEADTTLAICATWQKANEIIHKEFEEMVAGRKKNDEYIKEEYKDDEELLKIFGDSEELKIEDYYKVEECEVLE